MRRTKTTQPLKSKIEVPWDTTSNLNADSQVSMALEQIVLPSNQPRRYFDPEALKQLSESIKQHGILQPLLVRPIDGEKHELVAGERRYRAALSVELKVVPVVIRQLDDNTASQFALIENLLREDLNPVEETEGILQVLALKLGRNVEDIPPLLRRLQHERKESALSDKNVLVQESSDSDNDTENDDVVNQKLSLDSSSNNVIGKESSENLDADKNVLVQESSDSDNDTENDDVVNQKLSLDSSSNNVIGKESSETQSDSPQVNPDLKSVEEVFDSLGLMTWESFANNRLPLLNLPEDILDALRKGSLEYTKARAIAQIQKLDERVAFLESAIAQNWSLSEIKQRISEKKTPASNQKAESNDYKERFTAATTKLKKSRVWSDPLKRKQIEKLLTQLEALTIES